MRADSGRVVTLDVRVSATVFGQEGQRALKLEEQITQLFDELRAPVYRYLVCLGVCSADADETIQETFLRLYRHLHAGGREDNLRGWVFRVAHNISINERKVRKCVAPSPPGSGPGASVADPMPGPEELMLRREKMARVHAGISALSDQQKQCLYLRAEGFRYREIAEIVGVTISTVAESLRRAIKKLTRECDG